MRSTITNVLYIPDLSRNLFSEGVLVKNGLKIIKVNDSAEVFDRHRLVACAIRANKQSIHNAVSHGCGYGSEYCFAW